MRGKNDFNNGASPKESFTLENLAKKRPNKIDIAPMTNKTLLHEKNNRRPSQIIGERRKLKLGASSWIPMALPQLRWSMEEVNRAIPEGKYNAAAIPTMNRPVRILIKF